MSKRKNRKKELGLGMIAVVLLVSYLLIFQCTNSTGDKQSRIAMIKSGVQDQDKKAALTELEQIFKEAKHHRNTLVELAVVIAGARRNVALLPGIARLAATFGYHTVAFKEIASSAAKARLELPQFAELAELAALKLSETFEIMDLAVWAADISTDEDIRQLDLQIADLRARADYSTLEEALAAEEEQLRQLEERIKNL